MATFGGASSLGSAVENSEIADDTITDAKINSAAAISGTKLQEHVKDTNPGVIPSVGITDANIDEAAAIAGSKLAEDVVRIANVTLSAANIMSMFGTPIDVIAAPGAGKLIVIENVTGFFDYGGTAFLNGGEVRLQYNTKTDKLTEQPLFDTGPMRGTADFVRVANKAAISTEVYPPNEPVEITNATGAFDTGNSVIRMSIKYRIVTL
jgi:hypothetical protein